MTWIKFALWLSGIYVIYYLAIILWDSMTARSQSESDHSEEFTFPEHIPAIVALPGHENMGSEDSVVSSGGVSLKQLFNLAREEAIEYIRPVSY
jgi:hypothetical protein